MDGRKRVGTRRWSKERKSAITLQQLSVSFMNEGLTQHDGIHCATCTELNQNLKQQNRNK